MYLFINKKGKYGFLAQERYDITDYDKISVKNGDLLIVEFDGQHYRTFDVEVDDFKLVD